MQDVGLIDIGTCVGSFMDRYIEQLGTYKPIYAFEPLQVNFDHLVQKYKQYSNIHIIRAAIWQSTGRAKGYRTHKREEPLKAENIFLARKQKHGACFQKGHVFQYILVLIQKPNRPRGSNTTRRTIIRPKIILAILGRPLKVIQFSENDIKTSPR